MGFEFAHPKRIGEGNNLTRYFPHPKGTVKKGHYGDDTQMSIAVAEFMLAKAPRSTIYIARSFVTAFQRDPRQGYNQGFYQLLKKSTSGSKLMRKLIPVSDRSGGAMRAGPCGMLDTVEDAMDLAMWQASVTHATRDGMNAAAATAAIVWACRQGCDLECLPHFLTDTLPGYNWEVPWERPVPNQGIPVVKAALTALAHNKTMAEILMASVDFTGDVDTSAAVAMAAASQHPDVPCDLPNFLHKELEPEGSYGEEFLRVLDTRLEEAYPRKEEPEPDPPAERGTLLELL